MGWRGWQDRNDNEESKFPWFFQIRLTIARAPQMLFSSFHHIENCLQCESLEKIHPIHISLDLFCSVISPFFVSTTIITQRKGIYTAGRTETRTQMDGGQVLCIAQAFTLSSASAIGSSYQRCRMSNKHWGLQCKCEQSQRRKLQAGDKMPPTPFPP